MAYKARPFSLSIFFRVYEIDGEQVVRSRPSIMGFFAGDEYYEHLSEITVQSTGNRFRGNVDFLKNGQKVFSWENVLWPRAKRDMLEKLSQKTSASKTLNNTPSQDVANSPQSLQEKKSHSSTKKRVPGPAIDGR